MRQPVPFTIVRHKGHPAVATNGSMTLLCLDDPDAVRLRRAIRTQGGAPMAEKLLPLLNQLAGDVLQDPSLPRADVRARLHALQLLCDDPLIENKEWAYAELDGVRVYVDSATGTVVLTRQDLTP